MPAKPRYPLEAYLTHLLGEKERAFKELAAALDKVRQEEERRAGMLARLEQLESDHKRWMGDYWQGLREGRFGPNDIEGRRNHLEGLASDTRDQKRELLAQERAVQRAEQAAETVRQEFGRISNEVKVHQEKKDEWLREIAREADRKEQRGMEDLSTARHVRRGSGKKA
ncbi:MAG: hypothetical protein IPK72_04050 [Candidatus Eisenbacteria bacterium]|nr:hypothetical protein [Candidatus Eisenbacteria bacterium]